MWAWLLRYKHACACTCMWLFSWFFTCIHCTYTCTCRYWVVHLCVTHNGMGVVLITGLLISGLEWYGQKLLPWTLILISSILVYESVCTRRRIGSIDSEQDHRKETDKVAMGPLGSCNHPSAIDSNSDNKGSKLSARQLQKLNLYLLSRSPNSG